MKIALYGGIGWQHPFGLAKVLAWAGKYKYDGISLCGYTLDVPQRVERHYNAVGYDMISPQLVNKAGRNEFRRVLKAKKLEIACLSCYCPLTYPPGTLREQSLDLNRAYIDLAAALDVLWLRSIGNVLDPEPGETLSFREAQDLHVSALKELVPYARERGVRLIVETNENTTTSNAAELLAVREAVGPELDLVMDGANLYMESQDVLSEARKLAPHVAMLHVKNVRRREPGELDYMPKDVYGYEWTELPDGDIDWKEVLGELRRGGFDGYVLYEYVNPFKGMPRAYWHLLPNPEEAARSAAEYLRQFA
ncbi:MAG: sugar phosphate isomerase/epimerase [Chloroflexota bacterium]|nr:sugar phosphate isomerase/epimerase [Chloroflexota bacterium]